MKSKKKIVVIIVTIILLITGATFAYLYFYTDMLKTPEELFYKYVGKVLPMKENQNYQLKIERSKILKYLSQS